MKKCKVSTCSWFCRNPITSIYSGDWVAAAGQSQRAAAVKVASRISQSYRNDGLNLLTATADVYKGEKSGKKSVKTFQDRRTSDSGKQTNKQTTNTHTNTLMLLAAHTWSALEFQLWRKRLVCHILRPEQSISGSELSRTPSFIRTGDPKMSAVWLTAHFTCWELLCPPWSRQQLSDGDRLSSISSLLSQSQASLWMTEASCSQWDSRSGHI